MNRPPVIKDNTPEEEAEAQRQIASDPDAWPTPAKVKVLKRGRPVGQTKEQVTVRLDKTLLDALKMPDPKGWQTRLNEVALRGMSEELEKLAQRRAEIDDIANDIRARREDIPQDLFKKLTAKLQGLQNSRNAVAGE